MNTKITLVELARLMAEATSTSTRMCELFLRELFATVSQALINGESVKIKGIGTFKVTAIKPRKSVNVTTGETMEIKGYSKVTFTPDKNLSEAVNQPFAQFETVFLSDEVSEEKLAEIDEQYPSLLDDISNPPEPAPFPEPEYIPQNVNEPVPAASVSKPESVHESAPEIKPEPEPEKATEKIEETIGSKALAAFGAPVGTGQDEMPHEEPKEQAVNEPVVASSSQAPSPSSSAIVAVPEPDPDEDDDFHRPAPRNTYTPTQEQISRHQSSKNRRKLLWLLLAALAVGVLCWLFTRSCGSGKAESDQATVTVAVADSDSVAAVVAEPDVITDTVTSKIVLSTLSDKYYDSPWFWVYIYEENKAIIDNPDNVPPGTVVVIPPAEKYGIDANDPASLKKAQRRSWEILTQGKR